MAILVSAIETRVLLEQLSSNWKMERVDAAPTKAQRQQLQAATGVSGVSILFQLYKLYQFNPVLDMSIDRMHLTFNMLKREFIDKMWADIRENADEEVNARDPEVGGLLDHEEFKHALECINWTKEEKEKGVGGIRSLTDKLGSWKSNEFKSSVAKEVLAERIPSKAYDCYMLLCDAVQMLYSTQLQVTGWENHRIERLEKLL
ncbi:Hypothetical predicted protein [Paramuricea clavata]|uniref:Uncharacterized protein n=1 Tax=Paramuricea clavata TaxID=317549 RepID=A0A7D9DDQ3_PARCT|nr:Hypothetical predicted protein [Paramuricea clavata]